MSIDYLLDETPAPGSRIPLLPGIDWVRMPLPFALNHVNCWLLHDGDDRCLIDTGVAVGDTRDLWQQILGEQNRPGQLLATHFHPDHIGLAGWFAEQGSQLLGQPTEIALAQRLWHQDAAGYAAYYADWYAENGVGHSARERVLNAGNSYARLVCEPPQAWQFLDSGDSVELGGRRYEVLTGRGHAPAMLMLYCSEERLLIAADQILPGISPNVSLMPGFDDTNPLSSFLDSLQQLRGLPADTRVLPSHGEPFIGLHARIDAIIDHHEQRCDQLIAVLREPRTAVELFPVLFNRALDAQQLSFAMGETLAHLRLLESRGVVQQADRDSAGVKRFVRCQSAADR